MTLGDTSFEIFLELRSLDLIERLTVSSKLPGIRSLTWLGWGFFRAKILQSTPSLPLNFFQPVQLWTWLLFFNGKEKINAKQLEKKSGLAFTNDIGVKTLANVLQAFSRKWRSMQNLKYLFYEFSNFIFNDK